MALVLDSREVEVGQVAAVVDDALGVGVGEADPGESGELERRLAVGRLAEAGAHGTDPRSRSAVALFPSDLTRFRRFHAGRQERGEHHEALAVWGCALLTALALSGLATAQRDGSGLSLDQYKASGQPGRLP